MEQLTFEKAYSGLQVCYEEKTYTVYKAIKSGVYFGNVPMGQLCEAISDLGQTKAFKNCKASKKNYSKKITFDPNQNSTKFIIPTRKAKPDGYKKCCKNSWKVKMNGYDRGKSINGFFECTLCGTRYFPIQYIDKVLYLSKGLERLRFDGNVVEPFSPTKG